MRRYSLDATTNSPKTMNDTLMDRCRREARLWVLQRAFEADPSVEDTDRWEEYVTAMEQDHITVYASALYAERSKRPPTVQGPPMITVEEAINAVESCMSDERVGDFNYEELDRTALRERLTAAATNNTNDNGN